MFSIKEFFFMIPELFLLFSAVSLMLLYPATLFRKRVQSIAKPINITAYKELQITMLLIYIGTLLLLYALPVSETTLLFDQQYLISPFTQYMKFLILVIMIILIFFFTYQENFTYWEELLILTIFIVISGMFMISAYDYLILWLASEFQNFCFVLVMTLFRQDIKSIEGAMKFFVISAFMSSFFLLGVWLIYGTLGTINFSLQSLFMTYSFVPEEFPVIALGEIFILCYFLFKLAFAPFHLWTLDIFSRINIFIIYQLATVSKIAGLPPFIHIVTLFLSNYNFWFWLCLFIAFTSIIIGAFGAFKETTIKRFLAYSSINHFGWLLLPLSINDRSALQITLFYFVIYLILNVSLFLVLFAINPVSNVDTFSNIHELSFIAIQRKSLNNSLIVVLFSFIGIPPLLGFFGKAAIFLFFFEHDFIIIPILLIPMTAISALYYIYIIILLIVPQPRAIPLIMPISVKNSIGVFTVAILQVVGIMIVSWLFLSLTYFYL